MTKCKRVDLTKGPCGRPAIVLLEARVRKGEASPVVSYGWCRIHEGIGRRVMRDLHPNFWEVSLTA